LKYPNAADLLGAGWEITDYDFVDRLNGISEMAGKYTQFLKDFAEAAKRVVSAEAAVVETCRAATYTQRPLGRDENSGLRARSRPVPWKDLKNAVA
jgi:hypothetical protein